MNIFKKLLTPLSRLEASLLGFDLIEKSKFRHPSRLLAEALKKFDIDLVLDVGANKGQFVRSLRSMGYKGEVISFEPMPTTFGALKLLSDRDPLLRCYNFGLGGCNGEMELNVHRSSDLNSLLPMTNLGESRYNLNSERVKVSIRRLDDVLDELGDGWSHSANRNVFLKLDTQGYDLEVLKGLDRHIGKVKMIQTEASVLPVYEGMPTYLETMHVLEGLGFKPAAFATVTREMRSLALVEFDLIAVRREQ